MIPKHKYHFLGAIALWAAPFGKIAIALVLLWGLLLYPVAEVKADYGF